MVIQENLGILDKLKILSDAAKYDVGMPTSKRDQTKGQRHRNRELCGSRYLSQLFGGWQMYFSFENSADQRVCVYDCKYCINRCSNDVPRCHIYAGRGLSADDRVLPA